MKNSGITGFSGLDGALEASRSRCMNERVYNIIIGVLLLVSMTINCILMREIVVAVSGSEDIFMLLAYSGGGPNMVIRAAIPVLLYGGCVMVGRMLMQKGNAALSFAGFCLIALTLGTAVQVILVVVAASTGFPILYMGMAVIFVAVPVVAVMTVITAVFPAVTRGAGRMILISTILTAASEAAVQISQGVPLAVYDHVLIAAAALLTGYMWSVTSVKKKDINNAVCSAAMITMPLCDDTARTSLKKIGRGGDRHVS